jgi:mRNA interferase MazF
MPSFSRHEVILVRFPFSDLTSAKIRPAIVVGSAVRADLLIVPLTSRSGGLVAGEFALADWAAAGLNVPSVAKRGIYTVHTSVVLKSIGSLAAGDAARLEASLRLWLELP